MLDFLALLFVNIFNDPFLFGCSNNYSFSASLGQIEFFLKNLSVFRVFAIFFEVFLLIFCMKYQFIFNESKQSIDLKNKTKTVSTVWVPLWLDYAVKKGIARYGNMQKYLGILLKRYRFLFYGNLIPPSENPKTEYQKRGENYVIKKFRPELRDWLELGFWADSLGYSKAFMFVKLIEIDAIHELLVNEKCFRYISYGVTTPFYARLPQLRKVLRKGRSIFEREIRFYDPPH